MSPFRRLLSQISAFVAVGGLATALHYAVLIGLKEAFAVPAVPATLAGYVCGGLLSYVLNRRHTFETTRDHAAAVWRFALVATVGFGLTWALMKSLVDHFGAPYLPAQMVTTGLVMIWNFIAHRFWTFAAPPA